MKHRLPLAYAGATAVLLAAPLQGAQANPNFLRIDDYAGESGNAEILSFSPVENTVASTLGSGVEILNLSAAGQLSQRGVISFSDAFDGIGDSLDGASSVALDPLGRGFGAVSLIPEMNGVNAGKVGFFDFRNGSIGALTTVDVGFHPDSISFSADGNSIYVANEGENTVGGEDDAPGSLSIIDISSIMAGTVAADIGGLSNADVSTFDFSSGNLGAGVSIGDLRYTDLSAGAVENPELHIEPEFVTSSGNEVFVSLQENNGLAVFDTTTEQWTRIFDLGTIAQTVDASDRDGGFLVDDTVKGLPMPDTIAVYEVNGTTYVATANEGDFRGDDADRIRIKDISRDFIDDDTEAALDAIYGDFQDDAALGRLRVSTLDGNTDADRQYEEFIMPGTRSLSIWNAETGELVGDTGSLELILNELDPLAHNIDDGLLAEFDSRSDDKGPEPEALTIAEVDGRILAILGLERQNGILVFDITDPANIELASTGDAAFVDYFNDLGAFPFFAPESLVYIDAEDSPTGLGVLLVGYEDADGGIGVYSAVPIPAAAWMMLSGLGALVGFGRRRAVS